MNIAIGKLGKTISFNTAKWGPIGGDNEAPVYYENLIRKNPSDTFYILGRSDYSRLGQSDKNRINEHGNVIDLWEQFNGGSPIEYIDFRCKDETFDCGVIFAGPLGTNNVKGKTHLMKTPGQLAEPIMMLEKYAGPVISVINEHKFPYILIVNDPRYLPSNARDLMHMPKIALSQFNEKVIQQSRTAYNDSTIRKNPISCYYAGMETIRLIQNPKEKNALDDFFGLDADPPIKEKDINFLVVLNEGSPSRYKLLKESILDSIDDVEIFGKWNPATIGNDARFKGTKDYHELQSLLPRVKYSFCIPIKNGWVTSKFWEMVEHGIIPFLHKTYDTQNNLRAPEFLRVKNAHDLHDKISYLNSNPDEYDKLCEQLKSMIRPGYANGDYLNTLTIKTIEKYCK